MLVSDFLLDSFVEALFACANVHAPLVFDAYGLRIIESPVGVGTASATATDYIRCQSLRHLGGVCRASGAAEVYLRRKRNVPAGSSNVPVEC